MKKIAILLVLLCIAGAAAFYTATSPEFAVFRLHSAIKDRDVSGFENYADVKSIAHNLVQDQVGNPITDLLQGGGAVGTWLNNHLNGSVGPVLDSAMEKEIRSAVYDGAFNADHPDDNSLATVYRLQKELGFDQFTYAGMVYTDRQVAGDKAQLSLRYKRPQDGYELVAKVEVTRAPGAVFWRVSRIVNPALVVEELRNHPAPAGAPV